MCGTNCTHHWHFLWNNSKVTIPVTTGGAGGTIQTKQTQKCCHCGVECTYNSFVTTIPPQPPCGPHAPKSPFIWQTMGAGGGGGVNFNAGVVGGGSGIDVG